MFPAIVLPQSGGLVVARVDTGTMRSMALVVPDRTKAGAGVFQRKRSGAEHRQHDRRDMAG